MSKKIGLVGYLGYAVKEPIIGGQMSKTRGIYLELKRSFGEKNLEVIDTSNWKGEIVRLIKKCWEMTLDCSVIIIMPNKNGIKFILPFFAIFKSIQKYKLVYPVIGGWLPKLLQEHSYLARSIKAVDYILPETLSLEEELKKFVTCKMDVMPIFSTREILNEKVLPKKFTTPYPFCTFSRVIPEKGIDDAINAIVNVNQNAGKEICTLDIWGPIDRDYKKHYTKLFQQYANCITYKGIIANNEGLEVLASYYMLLFPTYYEGEGFPTTVCEGMMAGLPVIASDWKFNSEIVKDHETGFLFKTRDISDLEKYIIYSINNPNKISKMKKASLDYSKRFSPEIVMHDLIHWIMN